MHDAKVFKPISHKLREQHLLQTFKALIPDLDKIPNYLIGVPAFQLTPYCVKEFETCNEMHNGLLQVAGNFRGGGNKKWISSIWGLLKNGPMCSRFMALFPQVELLAPNYYHPC